MASSGLRPHVNRLSHITVNVSDLDRARAFWEATFPVAGALATGPKEPQPFPSLDLEAGLFRGWMLLDGAEYPSRGIHLVQWMDPSPVGRPYDSLDTLGWYRTAAVSCDVRARHEQVLAVGGIPHAEPRSPVRKVGKDSQRFTFGFPDPDGTTMEWVTNAPRLGARNETFYHVAGHCRDLAETVDFYGRVLGLDLMLRTQPEAPRPAAELPGFSRGYDGPVYYDAAFMCHRADQRNPLDFVQLIEPAPRHPAYASPFNLGIVRVAFEVDDIDLAYAALVSADTVADDMVAGPPEVWDFGELGTRRVVLFQDPDGLGLELIERPPYPWESDPARDRYTPLPHVW